MSMESRDESASRGDKASREHQSHIANRSRYRVKSRDTHNTMRDNDSIEKALYPDLPIEINIKTYSPSESLSGQYLPSPSLSPYKSPLTVENDDNRNTSSSLQTVKAPSPAPVPPQPLNSKMNDHRETMKNGTFTIWSSDVLHAWSRSST
eukprot:384533_1